jgi:hypothetical protein
MRLPRDLNEQVWAWVSDQRYDALLYFAQLMHQFLATQSPDGLRALSLDSYHRLRELERTWSELSLAGIPASIEPLVLELRAYLDRDPIITKEFAPLWSGIQPRLKSSKDRPSDAIEAVRYFARKIESAYLRKSRNYIEEAVAHGVAKNKREFRFVVENLCSYLLNAGYPAQSVYFRVRTTFFDRNVDGTPVREVQNFFSFFPSSLRRTHIVGVAVSEAFADVLGSRTEFTPLGGSYTAHLRTAAGAFDVNPQRHVFAWNTEALDAVDARVRCEAHLTRIRAVAYTAMPYAEMEWDPHVVVAEEGGRGIVLREPVEVLRRGRRRILKGLAADLEGRLGFFLNKSRAEEDHNRMVNALTTYASAFHSESPATQLLSLWSSLEGLLPTPSGSGSRISSFAGDVVACYKRLYLIKHLNALHHDLFANYRDAYSDLLNRTFSPLPHQFARLAAIFCLRENAALQTEIGTLCSSNPLARQRLFEFYDAGKKVGALYGLVSGAAQKVEWQLHRIYRERNRIVHRASPSANVETLILTLNAYIMTVFDAVLVVGAPAPAEVKIDDIFSEVRIAAEARERDVLAVANDPITADHFDLALGLRH